VALATLLAGFVASCSSAEVPTSTVAPTTVPTEIAALPTIGHPPGATPVASDSTAVVAEAISPLEIHPESGTHRGPTIVKIDADVPFGTVAYYTLDGSTPDSLSGILYEGEFVIVDDAIVTAAGVVDDSTMIDLAVRKNVIDKPPPDGPAIALSDGLYVGVQNVSIENNEPGYDLIYTLNGSVPSVTNGTVYSGPITFFKYTCHVDSSGFTPGIHRFRTGVRRISGFRQFRRKPAVNRAFWRRYS